MIALMRTALPASIPSPPPEALALSEQLERRISSEIAACAGWISFARYMELALYTPGLGYYSAGSTKLGAAGDFVTAPELSPLFAQCLARQVAQLIDAGGREVIEIGAGSGALASGLLHALAALDRMPARYRILETSADFAARQQSLIARTAPDGVDRVAWVSALPDRLEGVVIANEVLDALPAHVVRARGGEIEELGVGLAPAGGFERRYAAARGAVLEAARTLQLPDDYETEIGLAARALVSSLGERLGHGAMLFIDYGFPRHEYYHPQRSRGTLMCHYRHRAHDDPFLLPGLQDITTHVDFTAIADAALAAGHHVLGYAAQAQFLINCGIIALLGRARPEDASTYAPVAARAQTLLSPAEMGELFKVIAVGRGIDVPLVGFSRGDRTHALDLGAQQES